MDNNRNLFEKIAEARVLLGQANIEKSGWNPHAKFKYFQLDDFMPTARKICKEQRFLPVETFTDTKAMLTVYDMDSPEQTVVFECPSDKPNIPGTNPTQVIGGMITYLRRYLWMLLFEITESDEFDATQGMPEGETGKAVSATSSPSYAKEKDTRPASHFNPRAVWTECVKHFGYDTSKPADSPENEKALAEAHALFDPYAKTITDLTEAKANAILERLENLRKAKESAVGPEDFQDDAKEFGIPQ